MIITLYKNCILSNSYSEVFDCNVRSDINGNNYTVIEKYLATLQHYSYTLDAVYQVNSGSLIIDLENQGNSIYDYNYLKVSDTGLLRYCFIDNIEIGGEVATVYYSEDIWASYSLYMNIRNSYLSRTKWLSYTDASKTYNINPYDLPVNYDSNNNFKITALDGQIYYNIIAKLQVYNTSTLGSNKTTRFNYYSMISVRTGSPTDTHTYNSKFTLAQANLLMLFIYARQSYDNISFIAGTSLIDGNYRYEIESFYLVPFDLGLQTNLFKLPDDTSRGDNLEIGYLYDASLRSFDDRPYYFATPAVNVGNDYFAINDYICFFATINEDDKRELPVYKYIRSYSIENNFKLYSIGTMTRQILTENNGTTVNFDIYAFCSNFDFKVLLNYSNSLYDITNDFEVVIPYSQITSQENQLRKIDRAIGNINALAQIGKGLVSMAFGGYGIKNSSSMFGGYAGSSEEINKFYHRKGSVIRTVKNNTYSTERDMGYIRAGEMMTSSGSQVIDGITSLMKVNAPVYSTSKGTFIASSGVLNAINGIVMFEIVPDNEDYVQDMINNVGYNCYYIGNNEIINPTTIFQNYNVIKFDFVNIYGKFTQEIAGILKEILTSGTKIWYTENINNTELPDGAVNV